MSILSGKKGKCEHLCDSNEKPGGVFTPIVRLLWSESVDELVDAVRFLPAWFDSHMQNVKQTKLYQQKAMWQLSPIYWSQITWVLRAERKDNLFSFGSRNSYHPGTAHSERVCSRARAEWPCACCVWAAALISVYFSVLSSISFALQSVFLSCLSVLMQMP